MELIMLLFLLIIVVYGLFMMLAFIVFGLDMGD